LSGGNSEDEDKLEQYLHRYHDQMRRNLDRDSKKDKEALYAAKEVEDGVMSSATIVGYLGRLERHRYPHEKKAATDCKEDADASNDRFRR